MTRVPQVFFDTKDEATYPLYAELSVPDFCLDSKLRLKWRLQPPLVVVWDRHVTVRPWWLRRLQTASPHWVAGPPLGRPEDWDRFAELYAKSNVRVTEGMLVPIRAGECARVVPERHGLLVDVEGPVNPWQIEGQRVWLWNGSRLEQWRRYCEFRLAGVRVQGVLLAGLDLQECTKSVIGGDLHHHRSTEPAERNFQQSVRNIRNFWRAVSLLYD